MKQRFSLHRCPWLILALLVVCLAGWGSAEEGGAASSRRSGKAKKAQSQSIEQNAAQPASSDRREGGLAAGGTVSQELTEASKEAAGEEESNVEFKHSAAVRLIGKLTGLSPRGAYWVAILTNFAIIIVVVAFFTRKKLPAAFRARTEMIRKGIEEARRASEEANRRLGEVEARLSRLDSEIEQMKASAEQDAAAEEERLRKAAEEDKLKIVTAAEQEIDAAAKAARRDLKAYVADLAVALAEKRIEVDPATDRALVGNFVRELGGNNR